MSGRGTFLLLRFRYFLHACRLLIFRRWQWLLTFSLLLPGHAFITLAHTPGDFLILVTSDNIGAGEHVWILLSALLVACLWIIPQKKALRGYDAHSFFSTEPLSTTLLATITAILIVFSDLIFMIPAAANPDIYRADTASSFSLKIAITILEFFSFITLQLGIVERKKALIISPIIAVLPLALGLQTADIFFRWSLLLVSLAVTLSSLMTLGGHSTRHYNKQNPVAVMAPRASSLMRLVPPPVRIQIKSITEHPYLFVLVLAASSSILFGTTRLLNIFHYDERTSLTLATGLSTASIVLTCLYRPLKTSHNTAQMFTLTLPLKKNYWILQDIIFVNALSIPLFIVFITPTIFHGNVGFLNFLIFLLFFISLISTLRITTMVSQRHSVIISVFICVIWTLLITSAFPSGGGT